MRCISAIVWRPRSAIPSVRLGNALVGDRRAERLGLDDDEADVVRDDVVQLLRDPHALLGDRALGQQLALAVHPLGPLVQRVERGAPGGEVEAEGDRRRALHGEGHHVAEIDRMPVGDGVQGVAGDEHGGRDGRRAPRPRGGDRVEDDQRRPARRPHRASRRSLPRRRRPARRTASGGETATVRTATTAIATCQGRSSCDRLGDRGADHRHGKDGGERDVLRALRRASHPLGQGQEHALSVSPAPWPVGQISRVLVRHAPAAKAATTHAAATATATPSVVCTSAFAWPMRASATVGIAWRTSPRNEIPTSSCAMARLNASTIPITGPREPMSADSPTATALLSAAVARRPAVPARIVAAVGAASGPRQAH